MNINPLPNPSISPSITLKSISLKDININHFCKKISLSGNRIRYWKGNWKKLVLGLMWKSRRGLIRAKRKIMSKHKTYRKWSSKMHIRNVRSIKNKHRCTRKNWKLTKIKEERTTSKGESVRTQETTLNSRSK